MMEMKLFALIVLAATLTFVTSMAVQENEEKAEQKAGDFQTLSLLKELLEGWHETQDVEKELENTIETRAFTSSCSACICGVESNGGRYGCGSTYGGGSSCPSGCNWDVNSCSCGPYQIKQPYFTDCSTYGSTLPISSWVACATNANCARVCVQNYMARYGTYCTGKPSSSITCAEYGGIHNGGPGGCSASWTSSYRAKVQSCCNSNGC